MRVKVEQNDVFGLEECHEQRLTREIFFFRDVVGKASLDTAI